MVPGRQSHHSLRPPLGKRAVTTPFPTQQPLDRQMPTSAHHARPDARPGTALPAFARPLRRGGQGLDLSMWLRSDRRSSALSMSAHSRAPATILATQSSNYRPKGSAPWSSNHCHCLHLVDDVGRVFLTRVIRKRVTFFFQSRTFGSLVTALCSGVVAFGKGLVYGFLEAFT